MLLFVLACLFRHISFCDACMRLWSLLCANARSSCFVAVALCRVMWCVVVAVMLYLSLCVSHCFWFVFGCLLFVCVVVGVFCIVFVV